MDAFVCLHCRELEAENQRLRQRVADLEAKVDDLARKFEEAQRAGKRQAAPFSKGEPSPDPKTPGRKPGENYGKKGHRQPPRPSQIDETYEAPLPDACPDCGGNLRETDVQQQFQVEIPRKPIHRQFNIHIGCCQACGKRVQGRHPLQTSDALGAAAAQLGPDAQAGIASLNKEAGMSHGKIVNFLKTFHNIDLTRGGSVHTVLRAARRCEPAYTKIQQAIRDADWVAPDETGWREGGFPVWLHAWVSSQATCYAIDPGRSADRLEEIIDIDYDGMMIHDGWSSYDRFERAAHQQCLWHGLRRAHRLLETATAGAVRFPRQVITIFEEALDVRDRFETGRLSRAAMGDAYIKFTEQLDDLVTPIKIHAGNERFAQHLSNHIDDWFTFLLYPGLDATNYRAEQATRLGVVNRKVWGGNRTPAGSHAQEVLMSVFATCKQHLRSGVDFVSKTLCGIATRILPNASPIPTR